jgi:hypothetical protein
MKRIHLTASEVGGSPGTEPTAENLKRSGYLLRGWLTVRKIAEVKRRVLGEAGAMLPQEPNTWVKRGPLRAALAAPVLRDVDGL